MEATHRCSETVAILDAGSQYSKVIDRRIRELNVSSDIIPFNSTVEYLKQRGYKAIIISGGPESVYSPTAPKYDPHLFESGIPTLGICYGMQLMNFIHGGKIEKKDNREDGQHTIHIDTSSILFDGLEKDQEVLLTHGDSVSDIAPGFKIIAKSGGIVSAIENPSLKLYGLQFHPEVDLTHNGKKMLGNFLYKVCGLEGIYTLDDREHRAVEYIRNIVGEKKVLVLVSGGVDSSVCAALLAKAIGAERVKALHIDNGFMRKDESKKVMKALEVLGLHIKIVDAGETFLNATTKIKEVVTKQLRVSVHPEEKRKIIGDTFIAVAQQAIAELGLSADDVFLAQGTLRPDLIESSSNSVSSSADVIKTHHNDTDLVRFLRDSGRVVEPLKDYHKDEVRELGKTLGLPEDLVWRQPFPGPGLAIRVLCAEQPFMDASYDTTSAQLRYLLHGDDYLSPSFHSTPSASHTPRILKPLTIEEKEKVTNMASGLGVLEEVRKIGKNVFVTLVPVQTVGVQGDGRSYSYLVALSGEPNWSNLFFLSKLIPKIFFNINRIVYVFGEPVKEILTDITPTYLSEDVLTQLKEADSVVNDALLKYDLVRSLSQVPVVLFPSPLGGPLGTRSIAIRTFITNDFMTGVPAIPHKTIPMEALDEMVAGIKQVKGISRVVYDLTSKPPGTTEWE